MYNEVKSLVTTNWHAMRILRGVLSLIIIVQAVSFKDPTLGIFGGVFLLMTLFNTGCCAGGACDTGSPKANSNTHVKGNDQIEYEEIK